MINKPISSKHPQLVERSLNDHQRGRQNGSGLYGGRTDDRKITVVDEKIPKRLEV